MSPPLRGGDLAKEGKIMKNVSTLTIGFSIIVFTLLSATINTANPDSVSTLRRTDDISRSKAAFAVVGEEIARGLNLHTLSESDYWKLRGPVLLDPQTEIHFHLRKQFGSIVNTVDFGASVAAGSPSQNSPISRGKTLLLYKRASEIIRDFIAQKNISVIIGSHAPIGRGEMAAIRGLQGEVRYTYEIINSACVAIPIKNLAGLIRQPFITEIWPDAKGYLLNGNGAVAVQENLLQIGADKVHTRLGVTGKGVTVAVVDWGINDKHSEFSDRIKDTIGTENPLSDEKHGTVMAGIIGAAADGEGITGIAPEVNFLDASLLVHTTLVESLWHRNAVVVGYGESLQAINWTTIVRSHDLKYNNYQKPDVINMSLGWDPWRYGRSGTDRMSTLIDKLVDDGIVFVVSAGNNTGRRARGKLNALPANPANHAIPKFRHRFETHEATKIEVTLIWNNGSNDLDLVLLDSNGDALLDSDGNQRCVSRKHDGTGPWNNPWIGNTNFGTVFEQVLCDVTAGKTYTVQVEGYKGKGEQAYEVWLLGNEKCCQPQFETPNDEQTVSVPGYSRNVITVGAVDSRNIIAPFSGHGPSDTDLIKPEVVAPGVDIMSTVPGGYTSDATGTSVAAPHVAGVAALILDAVGKNKDGKWNFSPGEVKSAIVRGAKDIRNSDPDNIHGAGLVKADNIIFGGTVNPGEKLRFKITPRLTKYWFNTFFLNAENVFPWEASVALAVAISWVGNGSDLELEILGINGNSPLHESEQGSNYKKINLQLSKSFAQDGGFLNLNIIHNNPAGEPINFTGASTHPIRHVKLDVNDDGVVDLKDLVEVAKKFKEVGVHIEDINCDGVVDLDDMKIIAEKIAGAPAAPTASQVAIETIQQWLVEAKQMGNTDPDFLLGIAMLEQLLALLTPMETALLANYPNPFNPETWIPYQLATPADVTLTIYDIQGRVVRDLDLGHQRAGTYHGRSRAAHWDGRNTQGEPVASGLYFYTLKAGEFTATRKMLIRK